MRVNHHFALPGQPADLSQKFSRAANGEARGKTTTNASLRVTVPLVDEPDSLVYRIVSELIKFRRHLIAFIHHAFTDSRAKTALFNHAQDLFGMPDSLHSQGAGCATLN